MSLLTQTIISSNAPLYFEYSEIYGFVGFLVLRCYAMYARSWVVLIIISVFVLATMGASTVSHITSLHRNFVLVPLEQWAVTQNEATNLPIFDICAINGLKNT